LRQGAARQRSAHARFARSRAEEVRAAQGAPFDAVQQALRRARRRRAGRRIVALRQTRRVPDSVLRTLMAGHSHSANIQFRKDRVDSKRAKTFAKLSRMLTVAARQGGGSADGNPRLRLALDKARVASMSKEAIERAIRKGTGEADTENWEEFV